MFCRLVTWQEFFIKNKWTTPIPRSLEKLLFVFTFLQTLVKTKVHIFMCGVLSASFSLSQHFILISFATSDFVLTLFYIWSKDTLDSFYYSWLTSMSILQSCVPYECMIQPRVCKSKKMTPPKTTVEIPKRKRKTNWKTNWKTTHYRFVWALQT